MESSTAEALKTNNGEKTKRRSSENPIGKNGKLPSIKSWTTWLDVRLATRAGAVGRKGWAEHLARAAREGPGGALAKSAKAKFPKEDRLLAS